MEPMKIDAPSDQSVVNVRNLNSTKDFLKNHKKTVSMGVIVIGVLAIVSSVLSVTASGSSQQGLEIAMPSQLVQRLNIKLEPRATKSTKFLLTSKFITLLALSLFKLFKTTNDHPHNHNIFCGKTSF